MPRHSNVRDAAAKAVMETEFEAGKCQPVEAIGGIVESRELGSWRIAAAITNTGDLQILVYATGRKTPPLG